MKEKSKLGREGDGVKGGRGKREERKVVKTNEI